MIVMAIDNLNYDHFDPRFDSFFADGRPITRDAFVALMDRYDRAEQYFASQSNMGGNCFAITWRLPEQTNEVTERE